jgi:deferrochelatase/peroxidase EfeB
MKPHAFVNIVVPFERRWASTVDRRLAELADPVQGNHPCRRLAARLDEMPGLHYLSITVAKPLCPFEDYEGTDTPIDDGDKARLLIEISSDLGPEETIGELVRAIGADLARILADACVAEAKGDLRRFLAENRIEITAGWWPLLRTALGQVHCGSPGQSARRIRLEHELAEHVAQEIDRRVQRDAKWHAMSARQRLEDIRDWLWRDGEKNWKWAFVPEPTPCLGASPPDEISLLNPQIRKAAWRIFHGLSWPFSLLYPAVVAGWFGFVFHGHGFFTALIWSLHLLGYTLVGAGLLFIGLYLYLRRLERRDAVEDRTPSAAQVRDLLAVENFGGQNHLASISRLKPGLFRKLTLRLAFTVVGTGPLVSTPGFLGKNGVIHFARWMRLPGTDQLAFWSNYDDTWESYVADFIADAPSGVTAIWSNCVGFPRARSLFGGGAADRDRLVRWARRQQHPTRLWYQAYRDLTTARIRTNAAIRQGIASAESQQDCADWLSLFGSTPRPGTTLDLPELPTFAFGGVSSLRYSAVLCIALHGDRRCGWMRFIEQVATHGEVRKDATTAAVVGFTRRGLERLGVPQESIATFPVAFQQGMTMESRSRLLRDDGTNDPKGWRWGHGDNEVDAIVVVYGKTPEALAELTDKVKAMTRTLDHRVVHELPLRPLSAASAQGKLENEPFGFADGVSQPVVRGTPRAKRMRNENDLQEAGEFILGYPDNTRVIPPSPAIPARLDPAHSLADAGTDSLRKRPEASSYEASGWRDIGMNGSFLVVRQLWQHVDRFEAWIRESVEALKAKGYIEWERKSAPGAPLDAAPVRFTLRGPNAVFGARPAVLTDLKDAIQAQAAAVGGGGRSDLTPQEAKNALGSKLIGRWTDGSSVVRYANAPDPRPQPGEERIPDNDFTYAEDPNAIACPFGAHMRRANPRDTRYPGSSDEIAATNRHRMLRVGRAYGAQGEEQGLLFMCLNADIERQYEFVQRTWLLNPNMHGLQGEMDPLLAQGEHNFTVPTGYGPLSLPPLPQLVTVVGGSYFFLPSRTALRFLANLACDAEPMLQRVGKTVVPDLAAEPLAHANGLVGEGPADP